MRQQLASFSTAVAFCTISSRLLKVLSLRSYLSKYDIKYYAEISKVMSLHPWIKGRKATKTHVLQGLTLLLYKLVVALSLSRGSLSLLIGQHTFDCSCRVKGLDPLARCSDYNQMSGTSLNTNKLAHCVTIDERRESSKC